MGRGAARYLALTAFAGTLEAVVVSAWLSLFLALLFTAYWPFGVIMAVLGIAPICALPLTRYLVAPRGWVRVAYALGYFANRTRGDGKAYGAVLAAWALRRRWSSAGQIWLDDKLGTLGRLGDAEIIAHGFAVSARGDDRGAYQLLASVDRIIEMHPSARELAGEYLAVADAEAGRWEAILARSTRATQWPASSLTFFLEGLADPSVDGSRVGAVIRWSRWLVAPHRLHTLAIWRSVGTRTQSTAQDAGPMSVVVAAQAPVASFASALAVHVVRPAALGRAWDDALADPQLISWLTERAVELGVDERDTAAVVAHAFEQCSADVVTSLGAIPGIDDSSLHEVAARRDRNQRLAEYELAISAWLARVEARRHVPAIDEWRTFISIVDQQDQLIAKGGDEVRHVSFPPSYRANAAAAAWMWNDRKEYAISQAITRRSYDEAVAIGDSLAIEHEARNLRLPFPLRGGRVRVDAR